MKVRASNPFVRELIRGALVLGKPDLQLDWSGWEAEVDKDVIKKALEKAMELTRGEKLLVTNNDIKNPSGRKGSLEKLSLECFNTEAPDTIDKLLNLAIKRLDKLEGCGEEYASKIALMKAEFNENAKTPIMLGENEVVADALTLALAYAGFAWNLGNVRLRPKDFRKFFLIPIALNEDATNFLQKVKGDKRMLPDYVNNDYALALWIATNFNVNGTFKVVLVKRVLNKIRAETLMVIDIGAEREALERVFDRKLDEIKIYLNGVLRNVLSDSPDQFAVKFVNALYLVAHNALPSEELKILGLRDYASLLTSESEIPYVLRDIAKTALAVKI